MKKRFSVSIVLTFLIFFITFFWYSQSTKSVNPLDDKLITFTISEGESVRTIAQRLENEGLVRSSVAFFIKSRFTDIGKNIQAGDFLLSPSMDMNTIASSLQHGTNDTRITVPEGWRQEEIAMKIAKEFGVPEIEFLKLAREGYLFPDTYRIPKDSNANDIIAMFLANFDNKIKTLPLDKLDEKNITLNDLIIIASLVEREGKHDEDRPLIASVILNRQGLGMKLDIDATVQYALGYQENEKSWWKRHLTAEDLETNSAYNTYTNPGLPPSPIANPGLASIRAVLEAPDTDYLYYIADETGKSHFADDFEGHRANISKFLGK